MLEIIVYKFEYLIWIVKVRVLDKGLYWLNLRVVFECVLKVFSFVLYFFDICLWFSVYYFMKWCEFFVCVLWEKKYGLNVIKSIVVYMV